MRVSTEDQAENGVSLAVQEERLRLYCKMRDLQVAALFREEGVSAGKPLDQRPEGAKLLQMVKAGKADHVVALKVDRLWRDAENGLNTLKSLNRLGVALHIVDMGGQAVDTSKAAGWYFFFQMLGFAEFERRQISERTTAGLQHNKAHLRQYHNKPIYGFDVVDGQLVSNKSEQRVIRQIRRDHERGLSFAAIAEKLNSAAVPTKRGGAKWYASTVHKILHNDLHGSVPGAKRNSS